MNLLEGHLEKSVRASPSIDKAFGVSEAQPRRWADRWLFRGFFDSWWPLLKSRFLSFGCKKAGLDLPAPTEGKGLVEGRRHVAGFQTRKVEGEK
jgi:hypothetical protein